MEKNSQEKIILFIPQIKASRFKVFIPYFFKEEREVFKKINSSFYHPQQKLWSLINTEENIKKVKTLFEGKLSIQNQINPPPTPKIVCSQKMDEALAQNEQKLVLKGLKASTLCNS
ncbi:MAG: hypothetical protein M9887_06710 [Chitinophagales bacterium]|nr:hypothetical protein [Chitinophagales bacterium]